MNNINPLTPVPTHHVTAGTPAIPGYMPQDLRLKIASSAAQNETFGLSAEERAVFFEVIEATLHIDNQEQFFRWSRTGLQRIFPHGMMVCGLGRIVKEGVHVQHLMDCHFPQEYLQTLQRSGDLIHSPILAKWLQERQPILCELNRADSENTAAAAWLEQFRRLGLTNLAAHGQCDGNGQTASHFNFACIPGPLSPRHTHLLNLLMPYLHVALTRVAASLPVKAHKPARQQTHLTAREEEILQWLCDGKTNWEIAQVLGISLATVKHHVHHILTSLNVNSRTQAVAKAINLKLIRTKLALFLYSGAELLQQGQELFDICRVDI